MKIKLDENLSRHLKQDLSAEGHDVCTAFDEGLLGKSDEAIAEAAQSENRMLFTLDLEFADLRKYPPGSHSGIVLFRPKSMGPESVKQFVLQFVKSANLSDLASCVVVVDPNRIRIRRLHAL